MSVCIKVSVNMSGTMQSCLVLISLRSKRFRLVSEQRKTEERDFRHFRAVFDSRSSFFGPKSHGIACYAG